MSWQAERSETGVHHYDYSIGTSAGATNVVGWTNSGSDLGMVHTKSFAPGTYYMNIRAVNAEGLISAVRSSDGITVTAATASVSFSSPSSANVSPNSCINPMLAKATDGGVHLVYSDNASTYYRSRTLSGSWTAEEDVTDGNYTGGFFPDVTQDTNGKIRVLYSNRDAREGMDAVERVKTSGVWASETNITNNNTMNWYPRIVAGPSGSAYMVENGNGYAYGQVLVLQRYIVVCPNRPGDIRKIWHSGYRGRLKWSCAAAWVSGSNLVYRSCTGGTWSTAVNAASGSGYMMPRIACDLSNRPVVVWLGAYFEVGYSILFTRWTGTEWTAPEILGYGHYPTIAIDSQNQIHVAF